MVNANVKVNVPGLSSFDKSFKNIFTTKVGTLTPMVSKIVMPGAKGKLKIALSAQLPPLASDCFLRADFKVEAFLVPFRLLYGGFESWLTGKELYDYASSTYKRAALPRILEPAVSVTDPSPRHPYLVPGSLADYLGIRVDADQVNTSPAYFNVFKFLAYHRCYDDWYRSARISTPVFQQPMTEDLSGGIHLSSFPFASSSTVLNVQLGSSFNDGVQLGALRQRNYGDDYFTIAQVSAQSGSPQSVDTSGGSYTIASLRAANSLQQWSERTGLASPRLQDYVRAHYGADLNSGVAQRAILLGSASYPVYSKGVATTADVTATMNPFGSPASTYGIGVASGTNFVCDFECNEPSILMVIGSLVPEANYSTGITKDNLILTQSGSQVDLPDPLLENVGNEPIGSTELTGNLPVNPLGVIFGYVPRNTWYKTSVNEVHGLLRYGQSLAPFIPSRNLAGLGFSINSAFLRIDPSDLDNVTAVSSLLSNYGCWVDSFIDLKVAEPLTESAMPSLQDPAYEHGHSVVINTNGGHI